MSGTSPSIENIQAILNETPNPIEGVSRLSGDTLVGPLQAIRIGALGRVTAIPAAELSTTAADDYGVSAEAIDGPTNRKCIFTVCCLTSFSDLISLFRI